MEAVRWIRTAFGREKEPPSGVNICTNICINNCPPSGEIVTTAFGRDQLCQHMHQRLYQLYVYHHMRQHMRQHATVQRYHCALPP